MTQDRFESLYASDGSHPSTRGTYLTTAVFFEHLTGVPSSLGAWLPSGIEMEDKTWLDEAASQALSP